MGKIIYWIINGIGALVMLSIFIIMGMMAVMRIKEKKEQINTAPKLFKTIGRSIWSYIMYVLVSLVFILIIWIILYPPYPYNAFIVCGIIGFFVGVFYMANKKAG